jgi:hypothetical protein
MPTVRRMDDVDDTRAVAPPEAVTSPSTYQFGL